jgi:hypothetical protein
MQPNLFDFATSELSQDAFICWMISWAKKENKVIDEKLHETAILFLRTLFKKRGKIPPKDFSIIEVTRQDKRIDVLTLIDDEYAIVIEDKTNTSDGLEKLKKYIDDVSERKFPFDNIIPVYFKTGDQSEYESVNRAGYMRFSRKEFLDILHKGKEKGVNNQIYIDYLNFLQNWEDSVNSYKTLPLSEWHWDSWVGFFVEMQKRLKDGTWGYVPNQGGGFMGFWWHINYEKEYPRYLQIEEELFCFKIEVEQYDKRSECRNDWSAKIVEGGKKYGYSISKPQRFGFGTWMTVALLNDEYRKTDKNGILDINETVKFLKEMEEFLDKVIRDNHH